jgi:hypothetical protein
MIYHDMRRPRFDNVHTFLQVSPSRRTILRFSPSRPDGVCDMVHEFLRTKVKDKSKKCTLMYFFRIVQTVALGGTGEGDTEGEGRR